ncbi:MAG TPA: YraN family protein [Candidatus Kapabacteria bacterium]|jgi:putative endonuclease|nr:YraN family protein [Ignavibacteria bacterium]HRE58048.1 YraN family protein [Candidatus Kapabacteria bacterium]HRI30785.1 YraN family protein [Candidatus Kapabacteria bacterium]
MENIPTHTNSPSENLRDKGALAEEKAAEYLEQSGYKIIKRNFHFGKHGEIDIIAQYENILVFVEVKARWNTKYGEPEYAVTQSKIKALRRAAEGYLYTHKRWNSPCRFDVIAMECSVEPPIIRHIENAF